MKRIVTLALLAVAVVLPMVAGGGKEEASTPHLAGDGNLTVTVEEGPEYLHKLKLLPLIRIKSPPQLAVWTETPDGEFLETLYVTRRAGEQSWRSAPLDKTPSDEISRPEALPVWQHRARGEELDGRTGATPKEGYGIASRVSRDEIRVFLEVNHSTDFNNRFPKEAPPESSGYSGGPWGSGQPSLIYGALLEGGGRVVELELLGHGSPDGSNGGIHPTMTGITSARGIIGSVRARMLE